MTDKDEVQLFDMEKRTYPRTAGTTFRTLQVAVCKVCGSRTNKAEYIDTGTRALVPSICPNASACWHHRLEDQIQMVHGLAEFADENERDAMIAALRLPHVDKRVDDLVGNVDLSQTRHCVARAFAIDQSCPHDPLQQPTERLL